MVNKRTDHEEQDGQLVEDPQSPSAVPEAEKKDSLEDFFDFLAGEWKEHLEAYRYYFSQLLVEAEKPERLSLSHDPALCRLPDGTVAERYVNENEPNPLVLPDLFECMSEFPPGTEFSWQNVKADWGWQAVEEDDFDQVKRAEQMLVELKKMENLRLHLLEQRCDVDCWLASYPLRKSVESVEAEINKKTDWNGWLSQKGDLMSEYTRELMKKFSVREPVMAYSVEFAQRIFETIQRRS